MKDLIECARAWADVIIIGDHNSSDASASIAREYDKVKVVPFRDQSLDRGIRRKGLIEEARKVPGRNLIFTLDADEMISANWAHSPEWEFMLNAPPGTSFHFDWVELLPGLRRAAVFGQMGAFVDDGSEYTNRGTEIHESRMPQPKGEVVQLKDIKLLHYIAIDPGRLFSKHRWYKCAEYLETGKRPWAMCVMYQDRKIKSYDAPIIPVRDEWLMGYEWLDQYRPNGIQTERCYWHDEEVLNYFDKYGVRKFRKLNIWDVDWNQKARMLGRSGDYRDPRSGYEVRVHKFIEQYREELKLKRHLRFRLVGLFGRTVLRTVGW